MEYYIYQMAFCSVLYHLMPTFPPAYPLSFLLLPMLFHRYHNPLKIQSKTSWFSTCLSLSCNMRHVTL